MGGAFGHVSRETPITGRDGGSETRETYFLRCAQPGWMAALHLEYLAKEHTGAKPGKHQIEELFASNDTGPSISASGRLSFSRET